MSCFYLKPKQDDFNQIREQQVCIAEALCVRKVRLAIKLFERMALQSRTPRHPDIAAAVFTPCLTPTD